MISYDPPKQEVFGVGDYIDGLGTVLDPDDDEMTAFIEAHARAGSGGGRVSEVGHVTVRVDAVITDEQYHEAMSAVSAANEYIAALEADNAKLRELVVEVFKCARRGAACETCKVNNDGYACVYIMRELGIEVDAC